MVYLFSERLVPIESQAISKNKSPNYAVHARFQVTFCICYVNIKSNSITKVAKIANFRQ